MPTSEAPFISRTDVSDRLGRDVTADAGALSAVDAACDICRDVSEQTFNYLTHVESLDGMATDALLLHETPVANVGTVEVFSGGSAYTVGTADYAVRDDGVLLLTDTAGTAASWAPCGWEGTPVWPKGRQNVRVTYEAGYGTAEFPRSVREVALSIATRLLIQGPTTSESLGTGQSVSYGVNSTDLTMGERLILRRYRRTR